VQILLTGLLTGLSLIVAIGAQNSYVLRLGLQRNHVGTAVFICALSDAALILAGTAGIGFIVQNANFALAVFKWLGVAYLIGFGLFSLKRATQPAELLPSANGSKSSRKTVIAATMGFTFLNPHVYLDTLVLLGTLANQFGDQRWVFAIGASIGSVLWFSFLGFGAKKASSLMSKSITWRILDVAIAVIMFLIAAKLAFMTI
jgi:L-lysine exporter family protein LysE/ArgO